MLPCGTKQNVSRSDAMLSAMATYLLCLRYHKYCLSTCVCLECLLIPSDRRMSSEAGKLTSTDFSMLSGKGKVSMKCDERKKKILGRGRCF